jgi:two-component system cell cycle sensor histidine kinase/response regulator CckA
LLELGWEQRAEMAAISNMRLQWPNASEPAAVPAIPLETFPGAAAVVDPAGAVLVGNSEWLAIHPASPVGTNAFQWCATTVRDAILRGMQRVSSGDQARFSLDYTSNNATRRITISAFPGGFVVIDQELASADDHKRKQQSEKMETVGRLVGGVAHDFANLLTLIAGYSDIVLNRIGDKDPLRPELDEIRKAANRGARLTAQLLGFTRGDSVERRALDLNAVVSDLQRMLGLVIGEYVNLETAFVPNPRKVIADPCQMEQVIMNLILNARDAMPAGGRIRIETANVDIGDVLARQHGIRPGPCVTLAISDNGHGIDPEALAHIFEPFFTTKEKGKGTGLGLSTVHRIVKESGGDIWVRSVPGEGTTFTICLPSAPKGAEHGDVAAGPRVSAAGSETLLLVEDEDGVRKLLTHVLHKRGYQVIEASNGEDALRLFEARGDDIQLVLTDMVMPGISGRQLGERLRQLRPDLKIVYMSGYTDDVLVRTGALGPGMSFLQKPLRPEVLAAKVREALDAVVPR